MNELRKCMLCPRNCGVDRYKVNGFCGANHKLRIALAMIHKWEEPIISGKNGSGAIFFSNCNMKCVFCQNYIIRDGHGKNITIKRFTDICLELQSNGADNINLITPIHYVPQIKKGLIRAKNKGLIIPIIYNTSSYEKVDTIKKMNGLVDVYLADLKYYSNEYSKKYSKCDNYFEVASSAIEEMYNQVGKVIIHNDLIKRGLIVRILVLPGLTLDAKKIIKYLYDKYKDNIYISIMNQYTPVKKFKYKELNNKVSTKEYNDVVNYACSLGVTNAFIQEGDTCKESYIPNFNLKNKKNL